MLVVANEREEVFWEVRPNSFGRFPIVDAELSVVIIPRDVEPNIENTLPTMLAETIYPIVSEIVYGTAPDGYREKVVSRPLVTGETYCVLVFGQGMDFCRQFFTK